MVSTSIMELSRLQGEKQNLEARSNALDSELTTLQSRIEAKKEDRREFIQGQINKMQFSWIAILAALIAPIILISTLVSDHGKLGTDSLSNATLVGGGYNHLYTFEFRSSYWISTHYIYGQLEGNTFQKAVSVNGREPSNFSRTKMSASGYGILIFWLIAFSASAGVAWGMSKSKEAWKEFLLDGGKYSRLASSSDPFAWWMYEKSRTNPQLQGFTSAIDETEGKIDALRSDEAEIKKKLKLKKMQLKTALEENKGNILDSIIKQIECNELNDSLDALEILLQIDPANIEYQRIQKQVINIREYLESEKPYICSDTFTLPDAKMIDSISNMKADTFRANPIDRGFAFGLWYCAIKTPYDPYIYKALMTPFSKLKPKGHMNIDVAATLLYISEKYGSDAAETLLPDYRSQIEQLRATAKATTLRSLASIAAWCGSMDMENRFSSQLKRVGG